MEIIAMALRQRKDLGALTPKRRGIRK